MACKAKKLKVSWQQGLTSLGDYMSWISSCHLMLTCDSLGMHLSLGYDIPTIALFGPSPSREVYLYDKGVKIQAVDGRMESITVEQVMEAVNEIRMDKAKVS